MPTLDDENILPAHLLELEDVEKLQTFFGRLGYDVNDATDIDAANFNVTGDLQTQVTQIRRLAVDPIDGDIEIYLFELRRVNMNFIQQAVKVFQKLNVRFVVVFAQYKKWDELQFVLMDRVQRDTTKAMFGRTISTILRPRFLTLNRRTAKDAAEVRLAARTLKRFTFTEPNGLAQWDKLRSAYTVAEWSEIDFNNRKLFSDYYLNHRLTAEEFWNSSRTYSEIQALGSDLATLLAQVRGETARSRETVVLPLLRRLGFSVEMAPAGDGQPHYLLYGTENSAPLLTQVLAYDWNRNLDDRDAQRDALTPDEIPAAKVVSILEKGETPWVILTNGKLWRLYSTTTSNRATNYYEVELEEALKAPEDGHALKYWWFMFRPEAFRGFLDSVLARSQEYARGIRESLKSRIFTQIFPEFASGFISQMRAKGVSEADLEARLGEVFNGTMTLLYRLMFILYAESLELLPLNESIGYGEHSLRKMKHTIAQVAGSMSDHAPRLLRSRYTTSSTDLYEELKVLFDAINKGSKDLNLPAYNGGLFDPGSESGQFLDQYPVPDQYLALGLDLLTRDYDEVTRHELVMIDFKSLDVRHLGSVYEGLLEFRLSIAQEDLTTITEGNREVYIPISKAKGHQHKVVVGKGDVYLQNDKRERKATGSYYTPGYIVKYIIEHTVGPVLTRKLEALSTRLLAAQGAYRKNKIYLDGENKKPNAVYKDPEEFWTRPDMLVLADDCLNIRVLDPAMGSGHFLVQVVDYINERLLSFLEGWTENPVWALLERTRDDITTELEDKEIKVDTNRLTRIPLLKRAVLKRCVYGVDLNPMAVELAKVSLWLDAFTIGAPLSFLDHHLKCGNSLIGAMDLSQVVGVGSTRWNMILEAATEMVEVSHRTDSTVGQVEESEQDYQAVQAKLEDIKKYANVSVGAYFVDKLNEYRTSKNKFDLVGQTALIAYGTPAGDDLQALFGRAQATANAKRFFHWKLEFPEVFIDLETRGWAKDGGFDAVVGNPPYLSAPSMVKNASSERSFLTSIDDLLTMKWDLYCAFLSKSWGVSKTSGAMGVIIPNQFLYQDYAENLRNEFATKSKIDYIVDLGKTVVFDDATVMTCLLGITKDTPEDQLLLAGISQTKHLTTLSTLPTFRVPQQLFLELPHSIFRLSLDDVQYGVIKALGAQSTVVDKICYLSVGVVPHSEKQNRPKEDFIFDRKVNEKCKRYVEGKEAERYLIEWDGRWLEYDYNVVRRPSLPELLETEKVAVKIVAGRTGLNASYDDTGLYTDHSFVLLTLKHKLAHVTTRDLHLAKDDIELSRKYALPYVLVLLNSRLLGWYFNSYLTSNLNIGPDDIRQMPIRHINFTTPADERNVQGVQFQTLYTEQKHPQILHGVQEALHANRHDVVHDVLAFLAEQMIDLNKRKQAEVKRFLARLETKLKIKPKPDGSTGLDSLDGKTKLQNYLGDYQKGKSHTPFGDFWPTIRENHRRFQVLLTDIEAEVETAYNASLQTLLPIKEQLARTDLLIDQIVYQLYGLTEDEIALIERPQKEQALEEALAAVPPAVLADEENPDKPRLQVLEAIEPAVQRLVTLAPSQQAQASLDKDYPDWQNLPTEMQSLLEDAERDTLDGTRRSYNGAIIGYASVAERMINEKLFLPFRAAGYTENDVTNPKAFKPFMKGIAPLTLGNFRYVMSSKPGEEEKTFKAFTRTLYTNADARLFDAQTGLLAYVQPKYVDPRNAAGHGKRVCSQADAQDARTWTLLVLKLLD